MKLRFFQPDSAPTFKFSVMQLLYWGVYTSFYNYCVVYFTSPEGQGISVTYAGFAIAAAFFTSIIGRLFWGVVSDTKNTCRRIAIVMAVLQWVVILLFSLNLNVVLIILLMGVLGFVMMPIPPVLDSWTLKRIEQQKKQGQKPMGYTFVRMWSSGTTAVFSLLIGEILHRWGYTTIFVSASVFTVLFLFFLLVTGDVKEGLVSEKLSQDFKNLFRQRSFLIFLAACLLLGMAVQSATSFMSIVLRSVGGNDGDLGIMLFMAIIGEMPMIFLSGFLHKKIGARNCFFISIGLYIILFVLLLTATTPAMACFAMLFNGLSYGNFLPSLRIYSADCAPPELRTSALSITDGVFGGVAAMIGTMTGGMLIDLLGVKSFLSIGFVMVLVALALFLILHVSSKKTAVSLTGRSGLLKA